MEALPAKDLIAPLNWELAAYEQCDGCRSDRRLGLEEQFIVHRVVEETRRRFELAPA
jgi:hypothetical protein